MEKRKVAIYVRSDLNDNEQLLEQEKLVRKYCNDKNYQVEIVSDNIEELFSDIENSPIETIVVKDLAKLSRNLFELYDYVKYVDEICHCDIEAVNIGTDYKFSISLSKGVLDYE